MKFEGQCGIPFFATNLALVLVALLSAKWKNGVWCPMLCGMIHPSCCAGIGFGSFSSHTHVSEKGESWLLATNQHEPTLTISINVEMIDHHKSYKVNVDKKKLT